MKVLKIKTGWKVVETGKEYKFGEILLELRNQKTIYSDEILEPLYKGTFNFDKASQKELELMELACQWKEHLEFIDLFFVEPKTPNSSLFSPIGENPFTAKFVSIERYNELKSLTIEDRIQQRRKTALHSINETIKELGEDLEFKTIPLLDTGGIMRRALCVERLDDLFIDDMMEMLNRKITIAWCSICHTFFVKSNRRKSLCDDCSSDPVKQNKAKNQRRKEDPCRHLHKKINDILENRGMDEERQDFLAESNYYKDITNGKNTAKNEMYRTDITNRNEYQKWLEAKHQSLLKK